MRIAFFVPRCLPDNSHGRYVTELAARLARAHRVVVYTGQPGTPRIPEVHYRWLPVPNRPSAGRLATLWLASGLSRARHRYHVVHAQGADAPVGNVVTAHCCNAAMAAQVDGAGSFTRRLNYRLGAAAERYCLRKRSTRAVIAVSRAVKSDIERHYGVESDRIVVVPNGVNSAHFHPDNRAQWRRDVRARLRLTEDDFVVLHVGADWRLKGLPTLLEAARAAGPHCRVIALGPRAGDLPPAVRSVALGPVADPAPYYAAADCFAAPTRYDTFSLATLEAMASGLPVIVSRRAGVAELLQDDGDALLLADPRDVRQLAGRLAQLASSPELRARLGERARETAQQHDWDRVAEATLAVYQRVARPAQGR